MYYRGLRDKIYPPYRLFLYLLTTELNNMPMIMININYKELNNAK